MHQMKIAKLLFLLQEMLKTLSENEVRMSDVAYVGMYDRFRELRAGGLSYRETVSALAMAFEISRSTVERIISRLDRDVN